MSEIPAFFAPEVALEGNDIASVCASRFNEAYQAFAEGDDGAIVAIGGIEFIFFKTPDELNLVLSRPELGDEKYWPAVAFWVDREIRRGDGKLSAQSLTVLDSDSTRFYHTARRGVETKVQVGDAGSLIVKNAILDSEPTEVGRLEGKVRVGKPAKTRDLRSAAAKRESIIRQLEEAGLPLAWICAEEQ